MWYNIFCHIHTIDLSVNVKREVLWVEAVAPITTGSVSDNRNDSIDGPHKQNSSLRESSVNHPQSALSAPFPQMSMLLSIFIHFSALGQTLVCAETNIGFFQPCALWNPERPSSKPAGQWPSSPKICAGHCRLCFDATEPFWQSYSVQQRILSQAEEFFHETVVGRIGKYQCRTQCCKVWGHDQAVFKLMQT